MDSLQYGVWIKTVASGHLRDSLRTECVFCIDVKYIAIKATFAHWKGAVDRQLVTNLGLSTSKRTVDFHKCLGFETTAE